MTIILCKKFVNTPPEMPRVAKKRSRSRGAKSRKRSSRSRRKATRAARSKRAYRGETKFEVLQFETDSLRQRIFFLRDGLFVTVTEVNEALGTGFDTSGSYKYSTFIHSPTEFFRNRGFELEKVLRYSVERLATLDEVEDLQLKSELKSAKEVTQINKEIPAVVLYELHRVRLLQQHELYPDYFRLDGYEAANTD